MGRADEEAVIVKNLSAIKENLCTLYCKDRNGALNEDPRVNCANSSEKRVPKHRQPPRASCSNLGTCFTFSPESTQRPLHLWLVPGGQICIELATNHGVILMVLAL